MRLKRYGNAVAALWTAAVVSSYLFGCSGETETLPSPGGDVSEASPPPAEGDRMGDSLPVFIFEDTPEGKRVELRANDPESLRKTLEQIRKTPQMDSVVTQIETTLLNIDAMEEGGALPDDVWVVVKEELGNSLPELFEALGVERQRVTLNLD